MKRQQGFTLIELMITIAILGILMAIAVPAYLDYSIRARVSEGIRMASGFKTAVEEYRQTEGVYPTSANDLGVAGTIDSKYVTSVQVENGKIVVDISETAVRAPTDCKLQVVISPIDKIDNNVLTAVDWACRPGTTDNKCKQYLPSSCRKTS